MASQIIAISVPVTIEAGEVDGGGKKGPAKFNVLAYTGGVLPGALKNGDQREDVILDLAGMETGKSLIANLDHETPQRVGHVNAIGNDGRELNLAGIASAATPYRDQVVNSAAEGFVWQASIEANPRIVEQVKPGSTVKVNGQEFEAPSRGGRPLYVARKSTLKGFAFVSHGADDNTSVTIAASAASQKGTVMKAEIKTWAEGMGIDVDSATPEMVATIEANYAGLNAKPAKGGGSDNPFAVQKAEAQRRKDIRDIANKFVERRDGDLEYIEAIEKMHDHAIEGKMSVQEFRNELYESMTPLAQTVPAPRNRDRGMNGRILEAALCDAGRLKTLDKTFSDQELQAAHDRFPHGISLNEFLILGAKANGYRGNDSSRVTLEIQRAAFGMNGPREIRAQGWSTIDVSSIIANTANKFIREGWMAVDQTPFQLAAIRSVRNFQEITTVSLTGGLQFEKVAADGEIKHGTLGETTYGNKVDTYARMLAITRQDLINDDLGALTAVPRRLGRGGMLLLAHIFWTEFLNPTTANFFHTSNANVNTGVADMTIGGLAATEAIFDALTDPDGLPLSVRPTMIVVPPALKAAAMTLMSSERLIDGTGTTVAGDANIWRGRFKVVSSPYMSNSAYTGYSAAAWYMVADPNDIPLIEIVALNGKVEPTVDTADTEFNTLGVQMRGYSDVGVRVQEPRAGVRADGGAS